MKEQFGIIELRREISFNTCRCEDLERKSRGVHGFEHRSVLGQHAPHDFAVFGNHEANMYVQHRTGQERTAFIE